VGVGMVAGGGPMARLPQLIGRNRALEVLLSSDDISADQAAAYGYILARSGKGELMDLLTTGCSCEPAVGPRSLSGRIRRNSSH
jgi:enoyl-CoA hydratase/carnithine racemase